MFEIVICMVMGMAVGLIVRMLVHSRQYLGIGKATLLGIAGAFAAGTVEAAMARSSGSAEIQMVLTGLWAATGALIVTWAYVAYSIRWESAMTSAV